MASALDIFGRGLIKAQHLHDEQSKNEPRAATALIAEMQSATQLTAHSIETIVRTIDQIRRYSTAIANAVEEQGSATQEIAANTRRAACGTESVASTITGVRQSAQQTGASSQLTGLACALSSQANDLQDEGAGFMTGLSRLLKKSPFQIGWRISATSLERSSINSTTSSSASSTGSPWGSIVLM